jgi:flagellar protein FliS
MYGKGIGAYTRTGVMTADPKKLILMCYEEAIRNLKIAKEKYASHEYEQKAQALKKAQDFIYMLNSSLDFEKGGEIASNLQALYQYIMHRLTESDLKRDLNAMDHIIWMLVELKSAWEEIFTGRHKDINPDLKSDHERQKKVERMREMRV